MRKLVLAATLALCGVPLLSMSASAQRYGGALSTATRAVALSTESAITGAERAATATESAITGTERAAPATESAITGTENGTEGPGVVSMGSMNASTCAVIPTFANRSCAGKWRLAPPTIRLLVCVRVDGLAADWCRCRAARLERPH